MDQRLLDFTRRALSAGIGRTEIGSALTRAGWSEADAEAALGEFADVDFPVPVPRPKPYVSAREVFTYLVFFSALCVTAFNLGGMAFVFVEIGFPDPMLDIGNRAGARTELRWHMSSLVVAFPLLLFLFRSIVRGIERDPTRLSSRPRKQITYLALFVAGAILSGDLVALVYNFLGGELTVRFLLKVVIVAFLAGGIFAYFLHEMRREEAAA